MRFEQTVWLQSLRAPPPPPGGRVLSEIRVWTRLHDTGALHHSQAKGRREAYTQAAWQVAWLRERTTSLQVSEHKVSWSWVANHRRFSNTSPPCPLDASCPPVYSASWASEHLISFPDFSGVSPGLDFLEVLSALLLILSPRVFPISGAINTHPFA